MLIGSIHESEIHALTDAQLRSLFALLIATMLQRSDEWETTMETLGHLAVLVATLLEEGSDIRALITRANQGS